MENQVNNKKLQKQLELNELIISQAQIQSPPSLDQSINPIYNQQTQHQQQSPNCKTSKNQSFSSLNQINQIGINFSVSGNTNSRQECLTNQHESPATNSLYKPTDSSNVLEGASKRKLLFNQEFLISNQTKNKIEEEIPALEGSSSQKSPNKLSKQQQIQNLDEQIQIRQQNSSMFFDVEIGEGEENNRNNSCSIGSQKNIKHNSKNKNNSQKQQQNQDQFNQQQHQIIEQIQKSVFSKNQSVQNYSLIYNINRKDVWKKKSLFIIAYVNRFIFKMRKKVLIFRRPQLLSMVQLNAIRDKSAPEQSYGILGYGKNLIYNMWGDGKTIILKQIKTMLKRQYNLKLIFGKYVKKYKICRKQIRNQCVYVIKAFNILVSGVQRFFIMIGEFIPIFNPLNKVLITWQILITLLYILICFYIPFFISFNKWYTVNNDKDNNNQLIDFLLIMKNYFQIYSPILICIDIMIQSNTFYFEQGLIVRQRVEIFKRYIGLDNLSQSKFLLDILSIIALALWLPQLSLFSLLFILQLFFMKDFLYIQNYMVRSQQSALNAILKIIKLCFIIIFICHLLTCCWHYIGINDQQFFEDNNININNNWIKKMNLQNATIESLYLNSFYIVVVSLNSNLINGFDQQLNNNEKLFLAGVSLISFPILAYIINYIKQIFKELQPNQKQYLQKLQVVNKYFQGHSIGEIDPQLKFRTIQYLNYYYNQRDIDPITNEDVDLDKELNCLSKYLLEEIKQKVNKNVLSGVDILRNNFSSQFLVRLALKVKDQIYSKHEIIIRDSRTIAHYPCLYIVRQGEVEAFLQVGKSQYYNQEEVRSLRLIGAQQCFGELEFFTDSLVPQLSIRGSAHTTYVSKVLLSDFLQILQDFPEDRERYCALRDRLIFHKDYSILNICCASCLQSSHTTRECPYFFYGDIKQPILKKIILEKKKMMQNYKRKIRNIGSGDLMGISKYNNQSEKQNLQHFQCEDKKENNIDDDEKIIMNKEKQQLDINYKVPQQRIQKQKLYQNSKQKSNDYFKYKPINHLQELSNKAHAIQENERQFIVGSYGFSNSEDDEDSDQSNENSNWMKISGSLKVIDDMYNSDRRQDSIIQAVDKGMNMNLKKINQFGSNSSLIKSLKNQQINISNQDENMFTFQDPNLPNIINDKSLQNSQQIQTIQNLDNKKSINLNQDELSDQPVDDKELFELTHQQQMQMSGKFENKDFQSENFYTEQKVVNSSLGEIISPQDYDSNQQKTNNNNSQGTRKLTNLTAPNQQRRSSLDLISNPYIENIKLVNQELLKLLFYLNNNFKINQLQDLEKQQQHLLENIYRSNSSSSGEKTQQKQVGQSYFSQLFQQNYKQIENQQNQNNNNDEYQFCTVHQFKNYFPYNNVESILTGIEEKKKLIKKSSKRKISIIKKRIKNDSPIQKNQQQYKKQFINEINCIQEKQQQLVQNQIQQNQQLMNEISLVKQNNY